MTTKVANPFGIDAKKVRSEEQAATEINTLLASIGHSIGLTDIGCAHNFWSGVEVHVYSQEGIYMTSTLDQREFDLVGLLGAAREADRPRLTVLFKQIHEILRRHGLSR